MPTILTRVHTWMVNIGLANILVAVSEDMVSLSIREGVHAQRLVLISNGVKLAQSDHQAALALRSELISSPSGYLILSVGRLTYQKGHSFLLRALPIILEKYPDTFLALAGTGPLRDELFAQANSLGIAGRVHFLGVRSDIPDLLAASDLFVLPSRWEGLPLVILEAMSARRAIIATRVEGVSGALQEGQCGVLIPIENSQALADSVQSLLADPARRQNLADSAYQRYLQEYTQEKMIARYLELLDPNTHPTETPHAVDQE
jgi:glycosyltransferase involved in cell wall biosynthesis